MALHLENPELEALAAEVAALANESETEAIRTALIERRSRLTPPHVTPGKKRSELAADVLAEFRAKFPPHLLGKQLTREEEDAILGLGPGGF